MLPYCNFLYVLTEENNPTSEGYISWINFNGSKDVLCNITLTFILYFLHVHGTLQRQFEIDNQLEILTNKQKRAHIIPIFL